MAILLLSHSTNASPTTQDREAEPRFSSSTPVRGGSYGMRGDYGGGGAAYGGGAGGGGGGGGVGGGAQGRQLYVANVCYPIIPCCEF
jgi:hypothetical protein